MPKCRKLFLTGGSGLLALNWALLCHQTWHVHLGLHTRKIYPPFAVTVQFDKPTVRQLIEILSDISPDLVVNTAAATNVEYCELHPEYAFEINVLFAERLASACYYLKIPLVHFSTDHLFSGLFSFASEETEPQPLNVYAITKAQAEYRVLNKCHNALVVRTNFYGWGTSYRTSITDRIIYSLQKGIKYTAFSDVYFSPILISDLIPIVYALLDLGACGIFHVVGDQRVSKYDFGLLLAKVFGFQSSFIEPISIDSKPNLVQRPKDMSLSNQKASHLLGYSFGSVLDGLIQLKNQSTKDYRMILQQL